LLLQQLVFHDDADGSSSKRQPYRYGRTALHEAFMSMCRLQAAGASCGRGPVRSPDSDGILNYGNVDPEKIHDSSGGGSSSSKDDDINALLDDVAAGDPEAMFASSFAGPGPSLAAAAAAMPLGAAGAGGDAKSLLQTRLLRQEEIAQALESSFFQPGIRLKQFQAEGVAWMEVRTRRHTRTRTNGRMQAGRRAVRCKALQGFPAGERETCWRRAWRLCNRSWSALLLLVVLVSFVVATVV
jgi:hypothetical protein